MKNIQIKKKTPIGCQKYIAEIDLETGKENKTWLRITVFTLPVCMIKI